MKNPIRILLFASALASLSNHAYAQTGATIQFADPNFESSVRSQVEKGWIWVWGYTGNNYQFKTEDLTNISHLTLDPDDADGDFTSLADLQYFPNLRGLYIENASKITDFSPIWQLKVLVPPIFRACRSYPSFDRWIWTPANSPILIFWEVFRS